MAKSKIVERHLTVTQETFDKVSKMAQKQRRSMRAVVTMLIEEADKKSSNG